MMDAMTKIYELAQESGYSPNAYVFVHEILQACAQEIPSHITGKQLTLAAFIYSIKQYGALARLVWEELGLKGSEDLGTIVFQMVDANLMGKQEEDKIEDFDDLMTIDDFDRVEMVIQGTGGKYKYTEAKEQQLKIGYKPPEDIGSKLT